MAKAAAMPMTNANVRIAVRMTISPRAQLYAKMSGCNRRIAANVAKLPELVCAVRAYLGSLQVQHDGAL